MKYTNPEHTTATHNSSSGRVEDLLRLGYITQDDIDNAEPYKTAQELKDEARKNIESEVDRIINLEATSRGYKNIDAIAKYQGRTGPFSAQCDAMGEWVDACYVACFSIQAQVDSGERELPAFDEVAGLLPEFVDPGVTL